MKEQADVEDSQDAAVKAPTRAVVARSRLPVALTAAPNRRRCYLRGERLQVWQEGHWRVDCTEELCSRCYGRGHAPDVCRRSKKDAVLAVSYNDDDDDTVGASIFKAGQTGECSDVFGGQGERGVGLAGRELGQALR